MGPVSVWNRYWREFHVRVNLASSKGRVGVQSRHAITLMKGLPKPISQVVPIMSHIRSWPPYRSHLHPPSFPFLWTTLLSPQNTNLSHTSLSLHAMIMSRHQVPCTWSVSYTSYSICCVLHTPSTANTEYNIRPRLLVFPGFSWIRVYPSI